MQSVHDSAARQGRAASASQTSLLATIRAASKTRGLLLGRIGWFPAPVHVSGATLCTLSMQKPLCVAALITSRSDTQ